MPGLDVEACAPGKDGAKRVGEPVLQLDSAHRGIAKLQVAPNSVSERLRAPNSRNVH